ncbi:Imidazole glycerol phosphate synthase amidotransferase subunit [Paramagnetospirillum magnetotacticum MS-1]|uniref:Imidazole glycerol phosphate synthase subunit HisH n=1 Tax=Paramagnetospirillum magnetotacticum MS-1 TaxID=272627 RepID=A0A0C2YDW6_PARME|nr:imidazole glycerol phosphate synthase subunit HisH [Paramagnetospirillum magnetotacticum]KIL97899.1 Imidazole glycerol phosphate synthase amidotransferase subunit [Paramagnetospirillum magnetotacticum MS-1]
MSGIVAIIDYGSGNLRSAAKAFERVVAEASLNLEVAVTNDPKVVESADRIVLPGVGAFADCRAGLLALPGMAETLTERVLAQGTPFFGICVGMQLMASIGREHGLHAGLGWIAGEVVPLGVESQGLKVPHMGWNQLVPDGLSHPLLAGLESESHAYFVHSYKFETANPAHRLAHVDYGGAVTAVVGRDNMVGTQFHPEKSQITGLKVISNFLTWKP